MRWKPAVKWSPSACLLITLACAGSQPATQIPAASAPLTAAPEPEVRHAPVAPVPLEEYFKVRRISSRGGILLSFSYDEQLVAYLSDEGGRADIWVQPVAGGNPWQVTHASGFVHSLAFSPHSDLLVYEADVGGDELPHLFATDSKGNQPRDLTPDLPKGSRTIFVDWALDGKTFLYLSSERDEKYLDLWEYDVSKNKATRLWNSSGKLSFMDVSRDHKRFLVNETNSDADNNLYLVERGAAKGTLLTPHTGEVLYESGGFSKDSKTLHLTSDAEGEFRALYALDLAKKTQKPELRADWDVVRAGYSYTFKYFGSSINEDGSSKLQLTDAATHKQVTLPAAPPGGAWIPLAWSPKDRYLGVRLQSDATPTAPYIIDVQAGTARQVIEPLPASLRERKMAVGESVRVPSFDGKPVPAFLYRSTTEGKRPAIIDVHGGPTGQSSREFDRFRQYLVSKGYTVLVPNVRGSTGYGKTWMKADNLDLGGGPLKDVLACKQWLVKEADVDPNRVVVLGGSYGGYMALAAATFMPKEFAAHVDYFGVSDLKSLVESFPPYWQTEASYLYKKFGDPNNPEHAQYQHDRSPGFYVDKIERPLLVVQGDKDARVKKDQSDRIVTALKERGIPVHYLVLENEGHGFSKNENFLAAYQVTDRFLDRYVYGDTSVDVMYGDGDDLLHGRAP
jgi:dipeptidyl aminopeptidase/acylaminoacyl peptidase